MARVAFGAGRLNSELDFPSESSENVGLTSHSAHGSAVQARHLQ